MAGLSFGRAEEKLGWNAQPTCAVVMDNVRVPAASLLGSEGKGFNIAMNACEHMLSCVGGKSRLGVIVCAHIVIMSWWHEHVQRYHVWLYCSTHSETCLQVHLQAYCLWCASPSSLHG